MSSPLTRKHFNIDSDNPIVFPAGGLNPDTRLRVFETDIHVHSFVLKMHPQFFATFLDSPDKFVNSNVPEGRFKYDWVTQIDNDHSESWSLVALKDGMDRTKKIDHQPFTNKLADRPKSTNSTVMFAKMLFAMYVLPYTLYGIEDVKELVKLADYYRCLPTVSRTITEPILEMKWGISENPYKWIPIALKLRSSFLFEEIAIWVCRKWDWEQCFCSEMQQAEVEYNKQVDEASDAVRNGINIRAAEA